MNTTHDDSLSQAPTATDETATQTGPKVNLPEANAAPQTVEANEKDALLAEARAQATSLQEEVLRATAEAEKVRRRAQDDVRKAYAYAIEDFVQNLLPVVDSLEAALAHSSNDIEHLREGVELTSRQLKGALEKSRMVEINPVGEKFDPDRHQATAKVPAEQDADTVVAVPQKGYAIGERVLRPAAVTVAVPK
ncbi:MAG: molecular chaperone GrpE [Caballeronia sp.]|jgi:molecular chaperone GrpE|nr:molecular chaperone GrpE [Caballeronia sp.]